MIKEVFEWRKNDSKFVEEKEKNTYLRNLQVGVISKPH